jgi:hypothetical protein
LAQFSADQSIRTSASGILAAAFTEVEDFDFCAERLRQAKDPFTVRVLSAGFVANLMGMDKSDCRWHLREKIHQLIEELVSKQSSPDLKHAGLRVLCAFGVGEQDVLVDLMSKKYMDMDKDARQAILESFNEMEIDLAVADLRQCITSIAIGESIDELRSMAFRLLRRCEPTGDVINACVVGLNSPSEVVQLAALETVANHIEGMTFEKLKAPLRELQNSASEKIRKLAKETYEQLSKAPTGR